MALIPSEDRVTLLRVVEDAIPTVQSKHLQDILILIMALLHDYANLEQRTRDQLYILSGLTVDMQKVAADLHSMAKKI